MDVGEEVVVGEVVVGDRIVRDEAASSRVERFPKTLSPFSHTGLKRCGFGGLLSRPAVQPQVGMGMIVAAVQCSETLWREEEDLLVCISREERSPFYRHRREGREGSEGR